MPQSVLDQIPNVVDTCRECRAWKTPGPDAQTTSTTATEFNERVEGDILYYERWEVLHFICRASKWHQGATIENRSEDHLLDVLWTIWIGVYGAPKYLYFDGERAIASDRVKQILKREGCELIIRAIGQHPRHIDRRSALLRVTLHICELQLKRESVKVTFPRLLAEGIFAGNALITENNTTAYNTILGRLPRMLPPLETPDWCSGESSDGRKEARIREISLS